MPMLTRMSPYAYNFASRNRLMVFSSGTAGATLADRDANVLCYGANVGFASGTSTSGATADRMATNSDFEPIVPISMDKFFNMKFVWNMNGRNKGHQIHVSGCTVNNSTTLGLPATFGGAVSTDALTVGMGVYIRRKSDGAVNVRHIDSIGTNQVTLNTATDLGSNSTADVIFQGDTAADLMRVHLQIQ